MPALPVGELTTEVGNLWTAKGYEPFSFDGHTLTTHPIKQVVAAKEVVDGIPRHLTFRYRPADFAKVAIQHYATGAEGEGVRRLVRLVPERPVRVRRHLSLGPSRRRPRHVRGEQGPQLGQLHLGQRQLPQLHPARGPDDVPARPAGLGPVLPWSRHAGRGPRSESGGTGARCALCVTDGVLHGFLSMMTSAGTQQLGFSDHGKWQLFAGRTRVRRGLGVISPLVKGVAPGKKLKLVAETTPPDSRYRLSSKVTDVWTAQMPGANAVLPILRADYVPPVTTQNVATHRSESFPVTFDNLGPVDAAWSRAGVSWSVDGRSWHAAAVKRVDGNTFRVSYVNPAATAAHPYLSLRLTARDGAGRSLSEQVQHAYVLPKGRAQPPTAGAHAAPPSVPAGQALPDGRHAPVQLLREAERRRRGPPAAQAPDPAGWGAPALRDAYDLTGPSADTTVAVIVAYDYPSAEADMNRYRAQFGLPACTSAERVLRQDQPERPARPLPAAGLRLGRRGLARPPDDLDGLPDLSHRARRGEAAHGPLAGPCRDGGRERRGEGDEPLLRAHRADRDRHPGSPLRPPRRDRGRLHR